MLSGSRPSSAVTLAVILAVTAGTSGCTGSADDRRPAQAFPPEVSVDWTQVPLPVAPADRRVAVHDAAWCGDRWVVVGGLLGPGDASRPAAWTSSADARSWERIRFRTSTYWGGRAVLATVACRGTVPAAVGAMAGGAHGNPRVVTFRPESPAVWVDVAAPFEQYGGPSAVNVGPVASGEGGWLITGNRRLGPAAWIAESPRAFRLVERAPGLVGDGSDSPFAHGAVWDGSGWTIVGGSTGEGALDRVPVAWRSANGRDWTREPVPDAPEYEDLYRAVLLDGSLVAIGRRGDAFGSWVRDEVGWHRGGDLGSADPEARGALTVTSAAAGPGGVLTTVTHGAVSQLWGSVDGSTWSPVESPEAPVAVASSGTTVLVLVDAGDGGDGGQAWIARWPDLEAQ